MKTFRRWFAVVFYFAWAGLDFWGLSRNLSPSRTEIRCEGGLIGHWVLMVVMWVLLMLVGAFIALGIGGWLDEKAKEGAS